MKETPYAKPPYRVQRSRLDDVFDKDEPLPYLKVGGGEVTAVAGDGETCTVDFGDEEVAGIVVLGTAPAVGDWVEVTSRGNLMVVTDSSGEGGSGGVPLEVSYWASPVGMHISTGFTSGGIVDIAPTIRLVGDVGEQPPIPASPAINYDGAAFFNLDADGIYTVMSYVSIKSVLAKTATSPYPSMTIRMRGDGTVWNADGNLWPEERFTPPVGFTSMDGMLSVPGHYLSATSRFKTEVVVANPGTTTWNIDMWRVMVTRIG